MTEGTTKNKFAKWLDDREFTLPLRLKGELDDNIANNVGNRDGYDNCIIGVSTNITVIYSLTKLVNYLNSIGFPSDFAIEHFANEILYIKKTHSHKPDYKFPIIMRDMNLRISETETPGYHGYSDENLLALFYVE